MDILANIHAPFWTYNGYFMDIYPWIFWQISTLHFGYIMDTWWIYIQISRKYLDIYPWIFWIFSRISMDIWIYFLDIWIYISDIYPKNIRIFFGYKFRPFVSKYPKNIRIFFGYISISYPNIRIFFGYLDIYPNIHGYNIGYLDSPTVQVPFGKRIFPLILKAF